MGGFPFRLAGILPAGRAASCARPAPLGVSVPAEAVAPHCRQRPSAAGADGMSACRVAGRCEGRQSWPHCGSPSRTSSALPHLGSAAMPQARSFGADVFGWQTPAAWYPYL